MMPRPELILVSRADWRQDDLAPLTHLLAGAVAQETGCRTAIVLVENGVATALRWQAGTFVTTPFPAAPADADDLRRLIPTNPPWRGRVFVANLDHPQHLPAVLDPGVRFDRIVYVTAGDVPEHVPVPLDLLLAANAHGFSTFIPSILVPPKPVRSPWRWPVPWGATTPFDARVMPDRPEFRGPHPDAVRARLFRDACHVTIDPAQLAAAWPLPPGVALIDHVDPGLKKRAIRWSRAVTNRRVGVAISGGGAAAFRAVAFLEELAQPANDVPVDVVTGLSGGALVGAYYCAGGLPKVRDAAESGLLLQVLLPTVLVSSWPMELLIDVQLDTTRIDETEVRFVALATEVPRTGPADAAVVKTGTLGEAVRASGCLPPMFAPMVRNGRRYTDGGAAAIVPTRIARDSGADLTVAVNVIPGARTSNVLDDLPLGRFLHDWTPLGRLLDVFAWYTFLWARVSRRAADEATVFLEFSPQRVPFVECFAWWDASGIIDRAHADPRLPDAVADTVTAWHKLPKC